MAKTMKEILKLLQNQQKEMSEMKQEIVQMKQKMSKIIKAEMSALSRHHNSEVYRMEQSLKKEIKEAAAKNKEFIMTSIKNHVTAEVGLGIMRAPETIANLSGPMPIKGAAGINPSSDRRGRSQHIDRANGSKHESDRASGALYEPDRTSDALHKPNRAIDALYSPDGASDVLNNNSDITSDVLYHPGRANDLFYNQDRASDTALQLEKEIDRRLNLGQFKEAFELAAEHNLMVYACSRMDFDDPQFLCDTSLTVLLISRLSEDLHNNTKRRFILLVQLVGILVNCTDLPRILITDLLHDLRERLEAYLAGAIQYGEAEDVRKCIDIIRSINWNLNEF